MKVFFNLILLLHFLFIIFILEIFPLLLSFKVSFLSKGCKLKLNMFFVCRFKGNPKNCIFLQVAFIFPFPSSELWWSPSDCIFRDCEPKMVLSAEKEKVYSRQYSAPILKRKSSRFGLGQLLGTVPASASMPGSVCACHYA